MLKIDASKKLKQCSLVPGNEIYLMKTPPVLFSLWPWALFIFFGILIASLIGFVVLCLRHPDHLVSGDYYEQEIAYQQRLEQMNRTAPLRSKVRVIFDAKTESIQISLPEDHAGEQIVGTILLYRPSTSHLDLPLPLQVDGKGFQKIEAPDLAPGLWSVRIQWKVSGLDYYFDERIVVPGEKPKFS